MELMNKEFAEHLPQFDSLCPLLGSWKGSMRETPQEALFHEEGDVLTHTRMVCDALVQTDAYREEDSQRRMILYLAALFHDIGKVLTTEKVDGRWTAPNHARKGSQIARTILWRELGLCGTPEKQNIRESICSLIRFHSLPMKDIDDPLGTSKLFRSASDGELCPGFTIKRLCALSEADAKGRYCADQQELLDQVELCREMALDAHCYQGKYTFQSDFTRYAYFSGRNVQPDQILYDNTWGEIVLLSGLPGTGKDTWAKNFCPDLPMVSLDAIRAQEHISPTQNQGKVIALAREYAKEYLRKKQSFIWNATNLTASTRKNQVDLFTAYGASVKIIYLETSWEEQLNRNRSRLSMVPEIEVEHMVKKLVPPSIYEAHKVRWLCV